MNKMHHVSISCFEEFCALCGEPASHKIEEDIPLDDPAWTDRVFPQIKTPVLQRHPFSAYLCCGCFAMIFGPAVFCEQEF